MFIAVGNRKTGSGKKNVQKKGGGGGGGINVLIDEKINKRTI